MNQVKFSVDRKIKKNCQIIILKEVSSNLHIWFFSEIDSFVKKVKSGDKIKLESAHNYYQVAQIGEERNTRT